MNMASASRLCQLCSGGKKVSEDLEMSGYF